MLAFMLGCARIWFAMSRDGLLPAWFAHVHPRFRTPHRPTLIAGRTHGPRRGFRPDQGGCRIGEHRNALGICDHLPFDHRATADPARRPAHLPDALRPLDTASWDRVLAVVTLKAPYRRLGTVRRLDGARPSALLVIWPLAQRSRNEGKRALQRQSGRRPKPIIVSLKIAPKSESCDGRARPSLSGRPDWIGSSR